MWTTCRTRAACRNGARTSPTRWRASSRCTARRRSAAVIVEPVAGSAGVLVPPQGYLQRLRQICDRCGILLIFDEVITGFGRIGTPFGCERLGALPDLIAMAKALTNAKVPMGAVATTDEV